MNIEKIEKIDKKNRNDETQLKIQLKDTFSIIYLLCNISINHYYSYYF